MVLEKTMKKIFILIYNGVNMIECIENLIGYAVPQKYKDFMLKITEENYEFIYPMGYILERNETYQIQTEEPTALLIGQNGDLGFFIKKGCGDTIFSLDLGALGSLDMDYEAKDINEFISRFDS